MVEVSRRSAPARTPVKRYASMGRVVEVNDGVAEEGLGPLVKELSQQGRRLAGNHIELAKAELSEKAKQAGIGAGALGVAAVFALGMLGALTATMILALNIVLAPWLAAVIVTGVYALGAGMAAAAGRTQFKKAAPLVPQETVESLKEDVEWLKTELRSARR